MSVALAACGEIPADATSPDHAAPATAPPAEFLENHTTWHKPRPPTDDAFRSARADRELAEEPPASPRRANGSRHNLLNISGPTTARSACLTQNHDFSFAILRYTSIKAN